MSTKQDSASSLIPVETRNVSGGPCAGGMEKKKRNYRRLKSVTGESVVHLKRERQPLQKTFDPTAWYVADLKKRFTELKVRDFLNNAKGFVNDSTLTEYHVEAYVATQTRKGVEKVVISGKVFIRVDELNRVDVLRKCQQIKCFRKDPSLSLTVNGFTSFARVPNNQIEVLKAILEYADGTVEYSETLHPQVNDTVKVSDGILSESELLKNLKGIIEQVSGNKYATVVLDQIGCFKFRLPVSSINKFRTE